ncbi:carboxymuconolactone decarboxylase family protein [Bauldia sp.]|uniref:carboxymuconolactone decarboxylase family protein n=1 Tax=Bauldia sp. TaxID=2575872 RepID=UPI003BA9069A
MANPPPSSRREKALEVLRRLDADIVDPVSADLDAVSPDLVEVVFGFAFADVLSRPGIDRKTREMLTVAALTAMGTAPEQLEFHIGAAMNVGVSREEIIEIMLQMAVYAGVPAFMNGITAARKAFAARD